MEIKYKSGPFADDVGVVCVGDNVSVKKVFKQYERLTRKSGLELNADKTEIIYLHTDRARTYEVAYNGFRTK